MVYADTDKRGGGIVEFAEAREQKEAIEKYDNTDWKNPRSFITETGMMRIQKPDSDKQNGDRDGDARGSRRSSRSRSASRNRSRSRSASRSQSRSRSCSQGLRDSRSRSRSRSQDGDRGRG